MNGLSTKFSELGFGSGKGAKRREGRAFGAQVPELRVMGEGKRIRNRFSSGMNSRFYDKVLQVR